MRKLTRDDLLSLESYAAQRDAFRTRAIAHKRARTLHLGNHVTLLFEDRLTVQYQVQEMLRAERTFEAAGIEDELAAYNPLIPDGSNLKATMLLEFPDESERRRTLATLGGIEHRIYLQVDDGARVFATADEDLERTSGGKTSAVHFLRWELDAPAVAALRVRATLAFGIDDARMPLHAQVDSRLRELLLADLSAYEDSSA